MALSGKTGDDRQLMDAPVGPPDNSFQAEPASRVGLIQVLGATKSPPLPVALLSISQGLFGAFVAAAAGYFLATGGYVGIDDVPAWAVPFEAVLGAGCVASAVQLWRLRWSGPISFVVLWLLPFIASLSFAAVKEIITEASFIEGRISVFVSCAFSARAPSKMQPNGAVAKAAAPDNSFMPKPLRRSRHGVLRLLRNWRTEISVLSPRHGGIFPCLLTLPLPSRLQEEESRGLVPA